MNEIASNKKKILEQLIISFLAGHEHLNMFLTAHPQGYVHSFKLLSIMNVTLRVKSVPQESHIFIQRDEINRMGLDLTEFR